MRLSQNASRIDTDGASRFASNCLKSLGVDVNALQSKHPIRSHQWLFREKTPLPIFEVRWIGFQPIIPTPDWEPTSERYLAAKVVLRGDTCELLQLQLSAQSFVPVQRCESGICLNF